MKNQAFHFELEDLITQFIAALDKCVIRRFTGSRESKDQIEVRYVYAPKQRVIYDIVNAGKNLTLPVVTVNITQMVRDSTRTFNKQTGFYYPATKVAGPAVYSNKIGTPVPVNISVNVSIIAKYQTDLEQILQNFAAYANPYIILSLKVPNEFNLTSPMEIRSEASWSGSTNFTYPDDLNAEDKYRVIADTSWTIKGYLFPEAPKDPTGNIFFIDANFYAVRTLSGNPLNQKYISFDQYMALSGTDFNGFTETVHISAAPQITDIYYGTGAGIGNRLLENITISRYNSGGNVMLFGKMMEHTTHVAISSNNLSFMSSLTSLNFKYYPSISCYMLPAYTVLNNNAIQISMPPLTAAGDFVFIAINPAGYDISSTAYNTVLHSTV